MDEYARFAHWYDPIIGPFLRPVHRAMLDALVRRQCRSVVDLCCGTGLLAGMADHAGLTPTGVDISAPMLEIAKRKYPDLAFGLGDATDVPFEDNAFDSATISFALHEKPVQVARAILTEATRIVRPGGVVVIADYRYPAPQMSPFTGWGIRVIERMAGDDHHAHFTEYMTLGGSEGFLKQSRLNHVPSAVFMNGWVGVFVHTN